MNHFQLTPVGPDDVSQIHRLFRRWEKHWNIPLVTPIEEIAEIFSEPHVSPELDMRGVWHEGDLVAFGYVSHSVSGVRLERAFLPGKVDPDYRGCGIGRRLLAWQIERAVEKLRQCDPDIPWYVRTDEWDWVTDALHLYGRFGLEPTRWFEDLVRPVDTPIEAETPEGVEIAPWSSATAEETLRVSNAAFADHWGSSPRTLEDWEHTLASSVSRLDLSFVARAGDEVVGICLNGHVPEDTEVTGRVDGWIEHLGVMRAWRRRGVAAALIARSREVFWEVGFTHAMIGVDSDSPTGAFRLYRSLGFRPLHRSVISQRLIPPRTHS